MGSSEPGRLMIVGLESAALDADARALLGEIRPLGVILFARNMPDRDTLEALCTDLHAFDKSLLLAIDHEGGRVDRLPDGFTHFPPALSVTRQGGPGVVREVARAQGDELRALGFDINFAPVLDVHTNPANPIIGDRAFGTTPEEVTHHALPYLQGLTEAGLLGCGKHFPGHGDTSCDSHLELPYVDADLARMRSLEMVPFARAIAQGIPMIMTAHVVYRCLDAERPASLSPTVIGEHLRGGLGFRGVVVSDDLEMKAVAATVGVGEAAVQAVEAGSDIVLVCKLAEAVREAHQSLSRAIADGRIGRETLAACETRRNKLLSRARRLAKIRSGPDAIGCEAHRQLASRLG